MKRKFIIFFILLLFSDLVIFSISNEVLFLEEGSTHYIYEKTVNIRSKPSLESDIIGRAIIGEEVKIIKKIDKKEDFDNMLANWYKIKWKNKQGYIWGGFISTLEVKDDFNRDGKEELVLSLCIAYEGFPGEYWSEFENIIKVCRKGELISENPFNIIVMDSSSLSIINSEGFSPSIPILQLQSGFGDFPGRVIETQLFYWDNDKFLLIEHFQSSYYYNNSNEIIPIFPSDKRGEKNIIKMERKIVEYEFIEDTYQVGDLIKDSSQIVRKYKWNGNTFNKIIDENNTQLE
jgi:hypothetical protein